MKAISTLVACTLIGIVNAEPHTWARDFSLTSIPPKAYSNIDNKWREKCGDGKTSSSSESDSCKELGLFLQHGSSSFKKLFESPEPADAFKNYANSFQLLWNEKISGLLNELYGGPGIFPQLSEDPEESFSLFKAVAPLEEIFEYKRRFSTLTAYSAFLKDETSKPSVSKQTPKQPDSRLIQLRGLVDYLIEKLDLYTSENPKDLEAWELGKFYEIGSTENMWVHQVTELTKFCDENIPTGKEEILKEIGELKKTTSGFDANDRKLLEENTLKAFEIYNQIIRLTITAVKLAELKETNIEKYKECLNDQFVVRRNIYVEQPISKDGTLEKYDDKVTAIGYWFGQ